MLFNLIHFLLNLIKRDCIYLQLKFISTHAHLNVFVILYQ